MLSHFDEANPTLFSFAPRHGRVTEADVSQEPGRKAVAHTPTEGSKRLRGVHRYPRAAYSLVVQGEAISRAFRVNQKVAYAVSIKTRGFFCCYPTPGQAEHLHRPFGCARDLWNWALRMRTAAYRDGERVGHAETDRRFTALKRQPNTDWLNAVSSVG